MKTSNNIKVKVIKDDTWSVSQKRRLKKNEVISVSKSVADIWIRSGVAEKVKPEKQPKN